MVNTQIIASQCTELRSNPGYLLIKDAAFAWDRSCDEFGKQVLITGAWRSYATQERIFRERYRSGGFSVFNDYRTWPVSLGGDGRVWARVTGAPAAVPGTSNHGAGISVDAKTRREIGDPPYSEAVVFTSWSDADRTRFLRVAAKNGWYDDEGEQVNELWHLTWYSTRDQFRGKIARPSEPVRKGPLSTSEKVARVQSAVHATKDGRWDDETDRHVAAVRIASLWGGGRFPFSVEFTQRAVGTLVDGVWGGGSVDAHDATVRRLQAVLGLKVTGRYDSTLHSALLDLERKSRN